MRFELAVALSDIHSELPPAAQAAARALHDKHRRALAATAGIVGSAGWAGGLTQPRRRIKAPGDLLPP